MALRHTIDDPAFADGDDDVYASPRPHASTKAPTGGEPDLSTIERNVILFARGDPLASLEPPGPFRQAFLWLLGMRGWASPLADPRLEALRRAVIVTRHRRHLPDKAAADLRAWGYSEPQIRALEVLALRA